MNKRYTPFGKYFSNLRKEKKQTISEVSMLMNVSVSYISAVEHGDRDIPKQWINKIIEIYSLNDIEIKKLKDAYYSTPSNKKISLNVLEQAATNMINNFFKNEEDKKRAFNELKKRIDELR